MASSTEIDQFGFVLRVRHPLRHITPKAWRIGTGSAIFGCSGSALIEVQKVHHKSQAFSGFLSLEGTNPSVTLLCARRISERSASLCAVGEASTRLSVVI